METPGSNHDHNDNGSEGEETHKDSSDRLQQDKVHQPVAVEQEVGHCSLSKRMKREEAREIGEGELTYNHCTMYKSRPPSGINQHL